MEKQLRHNLRQLLAKEQFGKARKAIDETPKTANCDSCQEASLCKAELFEFLIDIGRESHNENDLQTEIQFLETNGEQLKLHFTQSTYYHNLANAKNRLRKIFMQYRGVNKRHCRLLSDKEIKTSKYQSDQPMYLSCCVQF